MSAGSATVPFFMHPVKYQQVRQRIIDNAIRELQARQISVEGKEEREAAEQRRKEDNAAASKKAAQEKLRKDIDYSRQVEYRLRREASHIPKAL